MKQPDNLRIAILFGGRSTEHEISILSAYNILQALSLLCDQKTNLSSGVTISEVLAIGITRKGEWIYIPDWKSVLAKKESASSLSLPAELEKGSGQSVFFRPGQSNPFCLQGKGKDEKSLQIDLVFPVLHGPYGEDGSVQGFLQQMDVPFVGGGVLASGIGMDKEIMKRLLQGHVAIAKFLTVHSYDKEHFEMDQVREKLGFPVYVKPANQGSSVGIHRIEKEEDLKVAVCDAFSYDHKVIIEENIVGRELECAVLGNDEIQASCIGEIVLSHSRSHHKKFYSYDAKYLDNNAVELHLPAKLEEGEVHKLQDVALQTYRLLGMEGLARVDLFLDKSGCVYVNEVNTMPGFTDISMYPGLWSKSGLSLSQLLGCLIALSWDRFSQNKKLRQKAF